MDIRIYNIYICICGRRKGEKSRVFWPRVLSLLSGLRWATFYTTSYSRLIVTRWMQYDIKRGRNSITGYTRSATKELGFSFPLSLSLSFSFYSTFLKIVVWLLCFSLLLSYRFIEIFDRVVCLRRNRSNSISKNSPILSKIEIAIKDSPCFFLKRAHLFSPSFRLLSHFPPSTIKRHFCSIRSPFFGKEIFDIRRMLFQYANL